MRISCGAGWVGVVVLVASCEAGSLGGSTSSVTVAGGRAVDLCGTWKGVELEASRSYSPSKWFDASHTFCQMIDVPVPASIDVAKGSSANQFATLTLSSSATGNAMTCRYRGTGANAHAPSQSYEFFGCAPKSSPGALLTVDSFTLHIDDGDQAAGDTVGRVRLVDPSSPADGTREFLAADPAIAGASLSVERSALPSWTALPPAVDDRVAPGNFVSSAGPGMVVVGAGVAVVPSDGSSIAFAAGTCARLTVPYDDNELAKIPDAQPSAIRLARIIAGHPGGATVEVLSTPTTVNVIDHLASACIPATGAYTATVADATDLYYHGGDVMSAARVYFIWYGAFKTATDPRPLLRELTGALQDSSWFHINKTYAVPSPTGGAFETPTTLTLAGETSVQTTTSSGTLTESDVVTTVKNAIQAQALASDEQGIYVVVTAPGISASTNSGSFCGTTGGTGFCGYHSYFKNASGTHIKYAYVGDPETCSATGANGCDILWRGATDVSPNGNAHADSMASVLAHEIAETVTDSNIDAWYGAHTQLDGSTSTVESADKCAWEYGNTYALPGPGPSRYANVHIGARDYLLQTLWVNQRSYQSQPPFDASVQAGYCAVAVDFAQLGDLANPTFVITGRAATLKVPVTNTGESTWNGTGDDGGYHLVASAPAALGWTFGDAVLPKGAVVKPGETMILSVPVVPPNDVTTPPGRTDTLVFQMAAGHLVDPLATGGHTFENRRTYQVPVVPPYDYASCALTSVPSAMLAGQTYDVMVTLTNTGYTTWSQAYHLVSVPAGTSTWTTTSVALPGSVPTSATVALPFQVTAPTAAGTYDFSFMMAAADGTSFFDPCYQQIVVSASSAGVAGQLLLKDQATCLHARADQNIDVVPCASTPDQTWSFDAGSGQLKSAATASCAIGASVAQPAHGTVALGSCSGAPPWTFSAVAIADAASRCFDAVQLGATNDEPVVMGDCGAVYTSVGLTMWTLTAAHELRVVGSNKCLDVDAPTGELRIEDCTGGTSQQWTLTPGGHLQNEASSSCLDAVSDVDGTPAKVGQCASGSGTQMWHVVGFLSIGGVPGSPPNDCLDAIVSPGIADVYGCDSDGAGFQFWSYSW